MTTTHWLGVLFLTAVIARALTRVWLASRQISAVRARRSRVPRAFEGQVSVADHEKAADYTAARLGLGRIGAVTAAAVALALTFGGGLEAIDAWWRGAGLEQPWLGTAVVLTVAGAWKLIELPFSIWRTFGLEGNFGFNRTSPRLFAADFAKRTALGAALVVALSVAAILLMENGGRWWWLIAWAAWLCVMFALSWAWPRFVAPLFNRFTRLTDPALARRVDALLERCGFASDGLFVMDGSRRSAHGNAYFTGVGRNKRIVLFDTLLARLCPAEVEAVLAHELGHFRLKHVRQRLFVSMALALVAFAALAWLARQPGLFPALGVPVPSTHAALLVFMIGAPAFTFFATPLWAFWSRRHELEADDFAVRHSSALELRNALIKIYRDNAANLTPDPIYSAFYDSHPPAPIRIARLKPFLDPEPG